MKAKLDGKRVALLVTEGFEQPFNRKMLEEIGEGRHVAAAGTHKGKKGK